MIMKNLYSFSVLMIILLSACSTNKKIVSGSDIFYLAHNAGGTDSLYRMKVIQSFKARFDDKNDMMVITPKNSVVTYMNTNYFEDTRPGGVGARSDGDVHTITDAQELAKNSFVFSFKKKGWEPRTGLRVIDSKFALQTLALPMKIRRPQSTNNIPTQADGSFTFGMAPGWKFNYSVHKSKKSLFGLNFNRYSLTPGGLVGVGTTDLKKGFTSRTIDRKEPVATAGFYLMFGFNNLNVGYATGWDVSIGDAAKDWYYHGRRWWGIAVGIDIIK
jgi:hypothetical protein